MAPPVPAPEAVSQSNGHSNGVPQSLNTFSRTVTQPKQQGGSQAMLYAAGLKEDDMNKAQVRSVVALSCLSCLLYHVLVQHVHDRDCARIASQQGSMHRSACAEISLAAVQVGISSVWFEGNPCNKHLLLLGEEVKKGVEEAGLVGFRFNTVGVSDAISMGTDGMSYSLQSRCVP